MTDVQRDLHVLVSIAKVDAALNDIRKELGLLPGRLERIKKSLAEVEGRESEAQGHVEEMAKERREVEQQLEDNEEKSKRLRVQLMEVKTNKEYTAMLHEIEHLEKDTGVKEERLLVLMDELEQETDQNKSLLEEGKSKKAELGGEQSNLEARVKELEAERAKCESEKPKLLTELDSNLRRRYERVIAKLHDFAVTHVIDETCQGCFTRIPPQVAIEVKKNDKLITCQGCGRILVFYLT